MIPFPLTCGTGSTAVVTWRTQDRDTEGKRTFAGRIVLSTLTMVVLAWVSVNQNVPNWHFNKDIRQHVDQTSRKKKQAGRAMLWEGRTRNSLAVQSPTDQASWGAVLQAISVPLTCGTCPRGNQQPAEHSIKYIFHTRNLLMEKVVHWGTFCPKLLF